MLQSKPIQFIKEAVDELNQVVWPSKEQVVRLTVIVIAVSVLAGLLIGGLDFVFTQVIGLVIK